MATGSKTVDVQFPIGTLACGHKGTDIFCLDHGVIICSTCASEKHISCSRIEPASNGSIMPTKKDFKHLGKDISEMKQALTKLKNKRLEDKKKLQEETDKAVKEIEDFRKLIDWVLDRMERKGKEYIQKRFKELDQVITEDISQCEEMLAYIQRMKTEWKSGKDGNKQLLKEQFINVKEGKEALKKAQTLCDRLKGRSSRDIVKFTVDPKVENFARNLAWFGKDRTYLSFEQPPSFPHLYEIKRESQFDIRVRGDKHVCCVVDMCQLEDGTILVADAANRRVKQLDVLYQIVGSRDLQGEPVSISCVNKDTAVVAIEQGEDTLIQFIEMKNDLPIGYSFTVPGKCAGLACSPDVVYVSIGSKICRYTRNGELAAEFDNAIVVKRIELAPDQERLILLDNKERLRVLDKHFEVSKEVELENSKSASDLAVDLNGQIFLSLLDSHTIVQYNHDLAKLGVTVGPTAGVKHPQAIVFDRINNRLVVGMKFKNVIKAFELK